MFQFRLINLNGNPCAKVYKASTNDTLATAYIRAFQEQRAKKPKNLISCTFRAPPSHEISDDLLAQIREELGNQFVVGRAGNCVKIEDRGYEENKNILLKKGKGNDNDNGKSGTERY